jgi:hypothetical protein
VGEGVPPIEQQVVPREVDDLAGPHAGLGHQDESGLIRAAMPYRRRRTPQTSTVCTEIACISLTPTTWQGAAKRLRTSRAQGQIAIALVRSGDKPTALSIIDSLKQRSVDTDVKTRDEKASWQGMWWRDPHPGWWSWNHAPIATQSMMVEAGTGFFEERFTRRAVRSSPSRSGCS